MEGMKAKLLKLVKDDEGLELSEYAVAGSLIVLGTIAAFIALSGVIRDAIQEIANCIGGNCAPVA
jgi:pilus assembly protein Flp/PilA